MDKASNSGDIDANTEEPSMSDNRTSAASVKPSRDEAEAAVRTMDGTRLRSHTLKVMMEAHHPRSVAKPY